MATVFTNTYMVLPTAMYIYVLVAKLSAASLTSPTQPSLVSPRQQHDGAPGSGQLVVKGKEPEENYEEQQPVEATDGGTNGKIYVWSILYVGNVRFSWLLKHPTIPDKPFTVPIP